MVKRFRFPEETSRAGISAPEPKYRRSAACATALRLAVDVAPGALTVLVAVEDPVVAASYS